MSGVANEAPVKVRTIAFVQSSLKFGGGERVALNLAHALKAAGYQIDFLLMSNKGEFLSEAQQHFHVHDLDCGRTWKLPERLVVYLYHNRPVALVSSYWKLNLCACLARIVYPPVRLLLWEHSPPSKSKNSPTWLYAITASLFYQLGTCVVAVSSGVFNDVQRITLGLRHKLRMIFNPIPPPHDIESKAMMVRPEGKKIIWVGRLDYPKNPGLMLEAFALIPKRANYTLDFVGDGRLRDSLEDRCRALGLRERVRFLGFQPKPYTMMAESDLLVLSSDREGLPSVMVEALYSGLRVVSTDCGEGIHDILLENRYGTIVPTGAKVALADAIERELNTLYDRQAQIEGAQRFLPQVIAQQFLIAMGISTENEPAPWRTLT